MNIFRNFSISFLIYLWPPQYLTWHHPVMNSELLPCINLKKSARFFLIPSRNACVKRVYSIMGNSWREVNNRLLPETVEAELQIKVNYNLSCEEFYLN